MNTLPEGERSAKTDSLLNNTEAFPITEEETAHFIYNGSGTTVQVAGDFTAWSPNAPMTNMAGTQFWYRTEEFDIAGRLDYKIVYNGSTWVLDPLNPYTAPGGFGSNSELRMPDYIPPVEIIYNDDIPHGTIESTSFTSINMNDTRTIKVYLPHGYASTTIDYPMVLVHDGLEYITFAKMDNTLDFLIHEELIQPCIAVFVPPVDRTEEYHESEQDDFTDFIVEEVMTWVDEEYRILSTPESHAVIGSSSGGNISLWLGMVHPEVFGNAGGFSPYVESDIIDGFSFNDPVDLKVYINHGSYDHINIIHQSVDAIVPILNSQGYEYLFQEYPEGHSYGFWRAYIDEALMYFFPGEALSVASYSERLDMIVSAAPNPFADVSRLSFSLDRPTHMKVEILNSIGVVVDTLVDDLIPSGINEFVWDGRSRTGVSLENGLYYVCVSTSSQRIACKKLVLYR
ncbi:MAG: hypothetical protein HKO93_01090 [Flavobacteriales bacterium]|nr:hypothetical protein [Flavobacteriales bacterium]